MKVYFQFFSERQIKLAQEKGYLDIPDAFQILSVRPDIQECEHWNDEEHRLASRPTQGVTFLYTKVEPITKKEE